MLEILITYLNSRIAATGYINNILCLAEIVEREKQKYPATYVSDEYKQVNLDPKGSVSYWRKSGDITYSQQENTTKVAQIEYTTSIPLKLVCFIKKDSANNDSYFADSLVEALKSVVSTNTAILNKALKAKKTLIAATKYSTNGNEVSNGEYSGIDYKPRYTHAYFSIDFEIKIISNQNCFNDICNADFTIPETGELVSSCTRVNNCMERIQTLSFTGDIDGINAEFVVEKVPEFVFQSGVFKEEGNSYTLSGTTVTFYQAPFGGSQPDTLIFKGYK